MDPASLNHYVKKYPTRELMDAKTGEPSGIVLVLARLAFAAFATPKKDDNGKESYQGVLIIPAAADLGPLRAAAGRVFAAEFGETWKAKLESGALKSPFKPQSKMAEKYDGFSEEGFFINVKRSAAIDPVAFFSGSMEPLPTSEIYSGMWAICKVRPYPYKTKQNSGVSFGINAIQKVADDEEFKSTAATDGFDTIEHHGAAMNGAAKPAAAAISAQTDW